MHARPAINHFFNQRLTSIHAAPKHPPLNPATLLLRSVMLEQRLRGHFSDLLDKTEVIAYFVLAILLFFTAIATIVGARRFLWEDITQHGGLAGILSVLDQLLLVLMVVEILHTVGISIRSHVLATEPFLVVGLIASIRRIQVISLEAATLTKAGSWTADGAAVFRATMIELALLGLLILVFSLTLLRR